MKAVQKNAAAKATMRNGEINGTQSLTFIWVCKMVRKGNKATTQAGQQQAERNKSGKNAQL